MCLVPKTVKKNPGEITSVGNTSGLNKKMKLSKIIHFLNVLVGFAGVATAIAGVVAGNSLLIGITREHFLLCSGVLMLIAIWLSVNTVHHVMLENKGEIV